MKMHIHYLFVILLIGVGLMTQAQSVSWSVVDTNAAQGDTILIPVILEDDVTGLNVLSFESSLYFYNASATPLAVITAGTLAEDLGTVAVNISLVNGYYHIDVSAAGTSPLSGVGVLFYIQSVCQTSHYIHFDGTNRMNEGDPSVVTTDGYVTVQPPPQIYTYPNSGLLLSGDQMQFYASYGAAPYSYSVSDTTVATIDALGLLTALQRGVVQVRALDSGGYFDWTDDIEIRDIELNVVDTNCLSLDTISVAIYASDLNDLDVISGEFRISNTLSQLIYLDVDMASTLLSEFTLTESYEESGGTGQLDLAFASTTPIIGSAPLVYIRFIAQLIPNNAYASVSISNVVFNQDLFAITNNGHVFITGIPTLDISPVYNQSLFVDETVQFTASNGDPPYQYSVVPATNGSIDATGLFTALSGGMCRVFVTDQAGQVAQSGAIEVFDGQLFVDHRCAQSGDTVLFPIYLSDLPQGQYLNSFEFTVDFRHPELAYLGYEKMNTLAADWFVLSTILANDNIQIVAAGSQPQAGDQVVLYLKYLATSDLTANEFAHVNLTDFIINEGHPHVHLQNGGIRQSNDVIYHVIASNQGTCNSLNNKYDQELIIYFEHTTNMGEIIINDSVFSMTSSPQSIMLSGLESDGELHHVKARFNGSSSCEFNFYNVFQAPDSCFGPPTIVYVDSSAMGNNNGLNWNDAFTDLQDALDMARQGNVIEVWVAKANYYPSSIGDRTASFALVDSLPIYGGFNGTETELLQRNPMLYPTYLNGNIGVKENFTDNSYHVVMTSTDLLEAKLDGFIITQGNANGINAVDKQGGGLINFGKTTLNHVNFVDNRSSLDGSAILSTGSPAHLTIINTIIDNTVIIPSVLFSIDNGSQFEMYGESELKN